MATPSKKKTKKKTTTAPTKLLARSHNNLVYQFANCCKPWTIEEYRTHPEVLEPSWNV
jgi:(p)ppGpp synthase/HD superfamily hydrolase